MDLQNVDLSEFSEALAQGIARADEIKRESADKHRREDEARLRKQESASAAVRLAAKTFCGRLLKELEDAGAMPKAVEFDKLWAYLSRCGSVEGMLAAIERELDWCAGVVAGGGADVAAFSAAAAPLVEKYRGELVAFTQGLLADGAVLTDDVAPAFAGTFKTWSRADAQKLAELLAEVRRAYAKYRRVAEDNGPFALHAVGEVETGEKLAECVDEMRAANAKPYLGVLDEDFMDHVNAFWFGFCKLGQLCEDRAEVDAAPLISYFNNLADRLTEAACDCELGDFDVFTVLDALREED